jgi:hypothetical protein
MRALLLMMQVHEHGGAAGGPRQFPDLHFADDLHSARGSSLVSLRLACVPVFCVTWRTQPCSALCVLPVDHVCVSLALRPSCLLTSLCLSESESESECLRLCVSHRALASSGLSLSTRVACLRRPPTWSRVSASAASFSLFLPALDPSNAK